MGAIALNRKAFSAFAMELVGSPLIFWLSICFMPWNLVESLGYCKQKCNLADQWTD